MELGEGVGVGPWNCLLPSGVVATRGVTFTITQIRALNPQCSVAIIGCLFDHIFPPAVDKTLVNSHRDRGVTKRRLFGRTPSASPDNLRIEPINQKPKGTR